MRVLLVTFTIGLRYEAAFEAHFRPGVLAYCARHGYDFRQVREPLDAFRAATRAGGILAQKLLVANETSYDAVVWLDADVYIGEDAPSIVAACPVGRICGTNQAAQLNRRARLLNQVLSGHERTGREWYADRGIDFDADDVLQSGVLVFWPAHHGRLCREVYDSIVADPHYLRHGEDQPFFSYEFLRREGLVHFLAWEWNAVYPLHLALVAVRAEPDAARAEILARLLFVSHFVHLASGVDVHLLGAAEARYRELRAAAAAPLAPACEEHVCV